VEFNNFVIYSSVKIEHVSLCTLYRPAARLAVPHGARVSAKS